MKNQYRVIEVDNKYIPQVYNEFGLYNWRSISHYGRLRTLTERIFGFMEWSIERDSLNDAKKSIEKHKDYKTKQKIYNI